MELVQGLGDRHQYPVAIAEYVAVPEADEAIAFAFDHTGPACIMHLVMLNSVDFDDQLGAVTGEIDDVGRKGT